MTTRRAFLSGLGALVAAPAVIRTPGLLMPMRRIMMPSVQVYHLGLDRFVSLSSDGSFLDQSLPPQILRPLSQEQMLVLARRHPDVAKLVGAPPVDLEALQIEARRPREMFP